MDGFSRDGDESNEVWMKYGQAMKKLGDFRLTFQHAVDLRFQRPMRNVVETLFGSVEDSKRKLQAARLALDTEKAKGLPSEDDVSLLKTMEAKYQTALQNTMDLMKSLADNPLVVQCLSDLVEAQRMYHKQCFEVLNALVII